MSLLLLLACLCGAAARGAPTAPRCLPDYELYSYCRYGGLGSVAPVIGGKGANDINFTGSQCPERFTVRACVPRTVNGTGHQQCCEPEVMRSCRRGDGR